MLNLTALPAIKVKQILQLIVNWKIAAQKQLKIQIRRKKLFHILK